MSQSSPEAKAATKAELDAEIAYFQSTIATHQHQIDKYNNLAKIPFFANSAHAAIAHEQAGIQVAQNAIKRYQDLEAYYQSIGRL